ncbi:hypothetical protein L202_05195 [Cryptococcus amylolentus CBS 6039]|uniref:Metallo-beta-lactamase domain-containing protein n=2 Tax=Cryptococcus amylolentus CBS 6039 TaxID=1295533 RepID=A0A1E3HJK1_9TREE|nr:hypothetical protein L202_05195 [Cryptococcus amylolentus CBS 6039]ODN76528.1 hypothetical protein L202_05195 [Cryptococcus amylolentus CBS 6039]
MSPPLDLTPVDKLEFLILVDNYVEWFSTLPPEFTHELPQHLASPRNPIDPLTGLPMIDLDNYCCGAHGLSVLIKTTIGDEEYQVPLDSGPEPSSIARNISAMSVDLTSLDALVLSHWHRDHSGDITQVLKLRQDQLLARGRSSEQGKLKVDLHPDRPIRRGIARFPATEPHCVLPPDPTFQEIEGSGGKVDRHSDPHEVLGRDGRKTGVGVSGEIRRIVDFEKGVRGGVRWEEDGDGKGEWFSDTMIMDERYIVIDVKGKGLIVFSSCSHAGICNVITSLLPLTRPIYAIIGGLHLVPTNIQPAAQTVDFIARKVEPEVQYVLPLHCTGLEARGWLREEMGDRCVPAGVGMKGVFEGGSDEGYETPMGRDMGFRIVM